MLITLITAFTLYFFLGLYQQVKAKQAATTEADAAYRKLYK